jgi:GGDEF domain-containing protein
MPETSPEISERPDGTIEQVLERIKVLHAQSATEKPDDVRITDGMSDQIIGETTLMARQALIEKETRRLEETAVQEGWNGERLPQEIAAMTQRITTRMFGEQWFESTLTTREFPIHSATYGTWMFRYDLRMLMAENPSQERLQEFAWIMFDVDALRSFKDCTSHPETTRYLQNVARIFVDPEGPTNRRLREYGVSVIQMATGGDEFVLYLRGTSPLSSEFIDQTIAGFQDEVSSSPILRASLDFSSDGVRMKYGMASSEKRKALAKLGPSDRRRILDAIEVPDIHIPSISGGKAGLIDGIRRAIEIDPRDLMGEDETFTTLREKWVQSTIDLAESEMNRNKENSWAELETTDRKRFKFRHRTAESRRLLEDKTRLAQRNTELEQRDTRLEQRNTELEKLLADSRATIKQLMRGRPA